MEIIALVRDNLPKLAYAGLFILLLAVIYFYSIKRLNRKESIIATIMVLVFPFTLTYNGTYYDLKFKGILFVMLVTCFYYLFFRIKKDLKIDWALLLIIPVSAVIIRMRFVFSIIVLVFLVYLIYRAFKDNKIKELLIYFFPFTGLTIALFFIQRISSSAYFLLDKFSIPDINKIISNFFLFPRQNTILLLLGIWLVFFNLILVFSKKRDKEIKHEVLFIIIPQVIIYIVYLLFFSNHDFGTQSMYLGLFPFLALNIIYFYRYTKDIGRRNRNVLLIIYFILAIVETSLGKIYIYI